jgi:hypothetical protein
MYKTVLVEADIEEGRRVLQELEKRHLQITAAFWFHEDEEDWKLIVVSPEVEEKGTHKIYMMVVPMLRELAARPDKPLKSLDRIKVVGPNTLLYKTVRDHSSIRYGPVREGPAFDSYIYKME